MAGLLHYYSTEKYSIKLPVFNLRLSNLYMNFKFFSSKNHTSRTITFYANNEDTVLRYTNWERLKIAYFMSFYVLQVMNVSFSLSFFTCIF